jgi:hypothetical protein
MSNRQNGHTAAGQCPLCGTPMRSRTRDPLVRALGLALIYGSAVLLLLFLPVLALPGILALALLAARGLMLLPRAPSQWCPQCWYVHPPEPQNRLSEPG